MGFVLTQLNAADTWLLLKINRAWACAFFDAVLPAAENARHAPWFLFGLVPAVVGFWLWRGRLRALRVLIVAVIAVAGADAMAYRVLKPLIARPRPLVAGVNAIERVPASGRYGFPSNHASNSAAAAAVLSVAYPTAAPAFIAVALAIGFSRVYAGAHYPGDVLAGFILGVLIGWPWAVVMLGRPKKLKPNRRKQ